MDIEGHQKCDHPPLDTVSTLQFGWALFRGSNIAWPKTLKPGLYKLTGLCDGLTNWCTIRIINPRRTCAILCFVSTYITVCVCLGLSSGLNAENSTSTKCKWYTLVSWLVDVSSNASFQSYGQICKLRSLRLLIDWPQSFVLFLALLPSRTSDLWTHLSRLVSLEIELGTQLQSLYYSPACMVLRDREPYYSAFDGSGPK